jgi:hypothetical protein
MANNNERLESFHEIPSSKYWWLPGDIAVPKEFFKIWTLTLLLFTSTATAIACLTTWWQTIIATVATALYLKNWYIGWPLTIGSIIIFYVWYTRRQKRLQRERAERLRMRRYQNAVINQNSGVKK